MTTLYRSPQDGELHETGPVDWEEDTVPPVCSNVSEGTTDDLETTRKDPTCSDCQEIGPKFEWSDDWNGQQLEPATEHDDDDDLVTDGGQPAELDPAVSCPSCGRPCDRQDGGRNVTIYACPRCQPSRRERAVSWLRRHLPRLEDAPRLEDNQ